MENTTEEKTEKYVTCPCCDSEIKWIRQFPFAQITHFERLPLPDLIEGPVEDILPIQVIQRKSLRYYSKKNPQIPEEVMQRLYQSDRISYQGRIYERVTKIENSREVMRDWLKENPDMTMEEVKKLFGKNKWEEGVRIYTELSKDVKRFLSGPAKETLETLESCVGTTVPTKDIFNLPYINHGKYPTDLREFNFSIRGKDLGECTLVVDSARSEGEIHFGYGPGTYMIGFEVGVAKFTYKGLFKESR